VTDRELLINLLKVVMNIIFTLRQLTDSNYKFSIWDKLHTEANELLVKALK